MNSRILKVAGLLMSGAILQTSCATAQPVTDQEIAEALPGYERTGETRNCINLRLLDSTDRVEPRIWVFEMDDGTHYLNVVGEGCARIDEETTFTRFEPLGTRLCEGELVEMVDRTGQFPVGTCALNEFERLEPRD